MPRQQAQQPVGQGGIGKCRRGQVHRHRQHRQAGVGALFARPIDSKGELLGMATGESLAHINHLVARGEAVAELGADGVRRYRAVTPAG